MKIIPKIEVIRRLNGIYDLIPSFHCQHCQQCSNPIIWFKAEEINIKEFLKLHHLSYLTYSDEEFGQNQLKCPYLSKNRCMIYPVRPLVCRLQGLIPELFCPNNNSTLLSAETYQKIMLEIKKLNNDIGGINEFFGTRKSFNTDRSENLRKCLAF